ncbi:MAG: EAL domain-containing protein [Cyanobacteria bacterium J06639_14]
MIFWGAATSFLTISAILLLLEKSRYRWSKNSIVKEDAQRYKDFAEIGADTFWELDAELRLSYLSGRLCTQAQSSPQQFIGQSYQAILLQFSTLEFDRDRFESLVTNCQPIKDFVFRLRETQNGVRSFKLNGRPIFDQHQNFLGYRGVQREITAEHNLAQYLDYQATHDSLTGLINRNEFDTRLQNTVMHTRQCGMMSVLCYFDLDQFKIINDTAGHLAGDQLLSELAHLLEQSVRSGDHLGRLGGDEFGLIIENCSLKEGKRICQRLIDKVHSYRFNWQGRQFNVGVSVGIVPISSKQAITTELLSRADLACYKAKDLGRGRIYTATYNDLELETRQTQMSRIANISQAIEENRLFLMQQPIQSIAQATEYSHVEILLRMTDEQGNVISPSQFIPIAERYGMISLIDRWVVEKVITQYEQLFPQLKTQVSINLSGASLSDARFLDFVMRLIQESTVAPECLCFEITETIAISYLDQAQVFIKKLQAIGVKFALDDFGSGVSSFGYLKNLPVDYLKIDGSLVRHIASEQYNCTIVKLINQVAHMMQMLTIAEFVEDENILNQLKDIGVDYAQGYGIGRPSLICPQVKDGANIDSILV